MKSYVCVLMELVLWIVSQAKISTYKFCKDISKESENLK
jgi:hypothetical protein